MQTLGENKAILKPVNTKEAEQVFLFTGEGKKPAMAIKAVSLREAEEEYQKRINK